jgi:hypothetical protein
VREVDQVGPGYAGAGRSASGGRSTVRNEVVVGLITSSCKPGGIA